MGCIRQLRLHSTVHEMTFSFSFQLYHKGKNKTTPAINYLPTNAQLGGWGVEGIVAGILSPKTTCRKVVTSLSHNIRCLFNIFTVNVVLITYFILVSLVICRSRGPRGLRRRSTAARLLRSWIRIPPGALMSVYYECCVLSGRGLCDELITRPEESYRLWCVDVCDIEKNNPRE